MTRKRLLICWLAWLSLWPWPSAAQNSKYDLTFKRWGEFYLPWQDWRWFKAQGLAESNLNQAARSPCGAIGIMQLMAATAAELKANPYDAESNIQAGVHYDAQLLKLWAKAAAAEQLDLVFGSYNAGPGNIEKAVRLAALAGPGAGGRGPGPTWSAASLVLPQVTGAHAQETQRYVVRIHQFYLQGR